MRDIDHLSHDVIGVAMRLHRELGPGLLESVYETILAGKLTELGFKVDRQKAIDICFEGMTFLAAARVDLLIDDRLIVEIKSVERLNPVHAKQVLTYLRLLDMRVGLVINFGEETLKDGIRRLVNNYQISAPLRETN